MKRNDNEQRFVSLKSLRGQSPASPSDILADIRRIYFRTTKQTIVHDLAHAIELLKSLPDEDTRNRAAVYMDGLAQMRSEFSPEHARSRQRRTNHKSPITNHK